MKTITANAVLCSTWGYEQTNATFFKVLKVKGDWATIQQLKSEERWAKDQSMTGTAVPGEEIIPGAKPLRRKIKRGVYGESIKVHDWGMYADPWNGEPMRVSCYG